MPLVYSVRVNSLIWPWYWKASVVLGPLWGLGTGQACSSRGAALLGAGLGLAEAVAVRVGVLVSGQGVADDVAVADELAWELGEGVALRVALDTKVGVAEALRVAVETAVLLGAAVAERVAVG